MPLIATRGAASAQGFGEFAQATAVNYIEDVFSTYLYTGNGSTQTITNGIDLAGKGGLVWIKSRMTYDASGNVTNHNLITNPSAGRLQSNTTAALGGNGGPGFTSTGFQVDGTVLNSATEDVTLLPNKYVSWTFREQPKFFDIVTYTGTGSTQAIPHNLGSVPGMYICKSASSTGDWNVYHRGLSGANKYLVLNSTAAETTLGSIWDSQAPTATQFYVGNNNAANTNGVTYVAYLFAHDAGGFGLTGTDNVISCGSFTNSGSTVNINLGYEAQFVLMKKSSGTGNWFLFDTMRGLSQTSFEFLYPNLSNAAEFKDYQGPYATATGFSFNPVNNGQFTTGDYIYIAIRRGPMAVPTLGTSVFSPNTYTGTGATLSVSGFSFPPDMVIPKWRLDGGGGYSTRPGALYDKLRGAQQELAPTSTAAESTQSTGLTSFNQSGFTIGTSSVINSSPDPYISWNFRRAPGFFDEVCYTGDSTNSRTITHNLGVAPELWIIKSRSNVVDWQVYSSYIASNQRLRLNSTAAADVNVVSSASSTTFTVNHSGSDAINQSGYTYVAYLFATCAGVSKVGGYTGTGALQTVACGFTSGARFVLIKRTDSTGDWYVWDSARGITVGDDPYLLLNSTATEVTNTNYVDTDTTGFKVTAAAPAGINANGGNYIFLAIA
jgi:hypothetical protein